MKVSINGEVLEVVGAKGDQGEGVPSGGTIGQFLAKQSGADYDTHWVDPPEGGNGSTTYLINAPLGAIVVWSGTAEDVPEGWSICNGENGTLDLRDKFVLGAGTAHDVGETGGSEEVTLTVAQMPEHTHDVFEHYSYTVANSRTGFVSGAIAINKENTLLQPNALKTSGSSQPHPNMPPYYTALYIQKTGTTPSDYATEERVREVVDSAVSSLQAGVTMEQVNQTINSSLANVPSVEEYDTSDGWHVRKYSDGYVEMAAVYERAVSVKDFVEWGGGYAISADSFLNFPFSLTKKYGESASLLSGVAGVITQYGISDLSRTNGYGFWRATAFSHTLKIQIRVFGRWK